MAYKIKYDEDADILTAILKEEGKLSCRRGRRHHSAFWQGWETSFHGDTERKQVSSAYG